MKKLLTFDKQDYGWSYLAMVLAAIAVSAIAVVLPLIDWVRGVPLSTSAVLFDPQPVDGAADGASAATDVVQVEISDAPASAWFGHVGLGLLFALAVFIFLALLWRFMRSLEHGTPFTGTNVTRLRAMGAILLFAPVLDSILRGLLNRHILDIAFGQRPAWSFQMPYQTMAMMGLGVVLLCIAEVFRRGVELEEDVEGLV